MPLTLSKWLAGFATVFVFVIGLVTPSLQTPSYATQEDSYALFSCGTDRQDKIIQIRAVEEEVGRRWSNIQYSFGREGEPPEMVFPRDASAGAKSLFFSHEYRGADYYVSIRFSTGGYNYRVFFHTGKGGAGVTVSNAQGKELSRIPCTERPSIYAAYLQRALACDLKNPHGKAACREEPYKPRK